MITLDNVLITLPFYFPLYFCIVNNLKNINMKKKKQSKKEVRPLSLKEAQSINGGGILICKDENGNWVIKIA